MTRRVYRALNRREYLLRRLICQLIVLSYFYSASCRRADAMEKLLPHAIASTLAYVCELATGGNRRQEVLCRRTTPEKSLLFRRFHSFFLHLSLSLSSVRSPAFSLPRSWPMNADPLMRADPAGLTRPDGCSWNLGTPLGRATSKIAV